MQQTLIAAFLAFLTFGSVGHATMINHGTYFTDTDTGLDWLDLIETQGKTKEYIDSNLSDWSYVSDSQYDDLLESMFGFSNINKSTYDHDSAQQFYSLFGITLDYYNDGSYGSYGWLFGNGYRQLGGVSYDPLNNYDYVYGDLQYHYGEKGVDGSRNMGTFLIRETKMSAIPTPSTIILFVPVLLLFFGSCRKNHFKKHSLG